MDEFALYTAYVYITIVAVALSYRGYGMVARFLIRQMMLAYSKDKVKPLSGVFETDFNSSYYYLLDKKLNEILIDDRIEEEEFLKYAELSVACYINNKRQTIKHVNGDTIHKPEEKALIRILLKSSLKSDTYRSRVVDDMLRIPRSGLLYSLFLKPALRGRMKSYIDDFIMHINGDTDNISRNTVSIVNDRMKASVKNEFLGRHTQL